MASWSVKGIFWITCLAVVSYAFPSIDGNGTTSNLKKIGYLEESADKKTFNIRDHEALLIAIKDSEELAGLSETGDVNNALIAMMNVSRCDVKNKTGHCVRNKRSTTRGGNLYWKLHNHAMPEGFPRNISEDWGGLEGPLDAAYTTHEGVTFFFKGSQFWKFVNKRMQNGYPKEISAEFPGIPNDVDAVFALNDNNKIYFFKGRNYWLYDFDLEPPVQGYPETIHAKWGRLLKKGIDAAFHWQDKRIYFFKDDIYYQYNFDTFRPVEEVPPYPHATGPDWFDCR